MSEHPDTEALSAFFDGEADEWGEHVRTCAECRRRLEAFGQVRAAVATSVPHAGAEQKDRAVAAALARDGRTAERRVSRWAVVAGVAAVGIGALVGVVATRDSGQKPNIAASGSSGEAAGPVSGAMVDAGDLGDVNDDTALRQKLAPHLSQSLAAPSAGASAQAEGGERSAGEAADAGGSTKAAGVPCEREARALQPGTEVLVYEATANWQGTPAVVLGFSPPGAPATSSPGRRVPTRVYVLARSGCRLLSFQSYAP